MKKELATTQANEVTETNNDETGFLNFLERAAKDPSFDVAKFTALLDVKERQLNKQAEQAFNQAYTRAKLSMPRVTKEGSVEYPVDKNQPDGPKKKAFKFAKYEDIDKAIRPTEQAEGFSRIFTTEEREGGGVIVHCTLLHKDGHSKTASIPVALDTSGGKNNIQAMGSSFSYGKRYTTEMIWDIVKEGDDNDGNYDIFPIDDVQFEAIQTLIEETGTDTAAFCKHLKVESLKAITNKQYPKAVQDLKAKKDKIKDKK